MTKIYRDIYEAERSEQKNVFKFKVNLNGKSFEREKF